MIGRESNRDRGIKRNQRQIWTVFEGLIKKEYIKIPKNLTFPEDLQKRRNIYKQEKAQVLRSTLCALKHRPAVPVRAGAVNTPLVLFWCCKGDKCDKTEIKAVFLVVSEKI